MNLNFSKKAFILVAILTFFVNSTNAQESDLDTQVYDNDGIAFTWEGNSYNVFKHDFDDDGITDMFMQPQNLLSQFLYIKGELNEDGEVDHNYGNLITSQSYDESREEDWSSKSVTLVFGQFAGDYSLDSLAFSHTSNDVYLITGYGGHLNFRERTKLTAQRINTLFPFSSNSSHYIIVSGELNDDDNSEVFAISRDKDIDGIKLDHFVVYSSSEVDEGELFLTGFNKTENKGKLKSKNIGKVFVDDFNNDGQSDVFIQGVKDNKHLYINNSDNIVSLDSYEEFKNSFFSKSWKRSDATIIVDDVNDDGLLDVARYSKSNDEGDVLFFTPSDRGLGVQILSTQSTENDTADQDTESHLSLVESDPQGAIAISWPKEGFDNFELEKYESDEWKVLYTGNKNFFYDVNIKEGILQYRVQRCIYKVSKKLCSKSLINSIEVVPPEETEEHISRENLLQSDISRTTGFGINPPPVPEMAAFAPSGLVGNQNYNVNWSSSSGADYYELEGENLGVIATVYAPTTTAVRNKVPGTYYYRVRACRVDSKYTHCSQYSNTSPSYNVSGTPGRPKFTYAPTSATASVPYTVSWDSGTGVIHQYQLHGEQSGTIYSGSSRQTNRTKGAGTYYYKTRACNSYNCSSYSPTTAGTLVETSNAGPDAINDSAQTNEDMAVVIHVLANDVDPDGDSLTIVSHSQPSSGGVTQSSSSLTYTPNADYCNAQGNEDTFIYTVSDGTVNDSATVKIRVICQNDAPKINNLPSNKTIFEDSQGAPEDFTISDIDTNLASISLSATSNNPQVIQNSGLAITGSGANRVLRLTPIANMHGSATITLTADDGPSSVSKTMVVNVSPVNDAPLIDQGVVLSTSTNEDNNKSFALSATDPENNQITWQKVTNPQYGTISGFGIGNSRNFTYNPNTNYNGTDSFKIRATDGALSDEITVNVTVNPVNDAPVIGQGASHAISTAEDNAKSFGLSASDPENNQITWKKISNPLHGIISGFGQGNNRTFTYTPNSNFHGTDSFIIEANDGALFDRITVNVTVNPVNDAPIIGQGSSHALSASEDNAQTFGLSATDPENNQITWQKVTNPQYGTISGFGIGNSRNFTYNPNTNYNGTDSFIIRATDGVLSDDITVNVTINPVNDAPVIAGGSSISMSVNQDTTGVKQLSASDIDSNTLNWSVIAPPINGNIGGIGTGNTIEVDYTPHQYFYGSDQFKLRVSDGDKTDTVTVNVIVNHVATPMTISAGNPQYKVEWTNVTVTGSSSDNSGIKSAKWEWVSGPEPTISSGNSDPWTFSYGNNASFRVRHVSQDSQLILRYTAEAYDGETASRDLIIYINDRPTGRVTQPQHGTKLASDAELNVVFSDVVDSSDDIVRTESLIRRQEATGWSYVTQFETMDYNNVTKQGAKSYGAVSGLGLVPNVKYWVTARAVDNGHGGGWGWWKHAEFFVNAKPEITSSNSVSGEIGQPITIQISDLIINDADDSNHSLEIQPGSNYVVSGMSVTFNEGTPAGSHPVMVTINDGVEDSDVFQFFVQLTEPVAKPWSDVGGAVDSEVFTNSNLPSGNQYYGSMRGKAFTSGGQASYHLPIVIPPGRAGMQPTVSIDYSSGKGNGLLGVGFNLSAISSISRCAKTLAQDDVSQPVQMDANDPLCFNGKRLIVQNGDYNAVNTTYRTELDSFVRVTQLGGDIQSASSHFKVEYRNGKIEYYGGPYNNSSQVSYDGHNAPFAWRIEKTFDRDSSTGGQANSIEYIYSTPNQFGSGESLLTGIYYTGTRDIRGDRRIHFGYENRLNFSTNYLKGGMQRSTQRLDFIETYVGATKVRRYAFQYVASEQTSRSLLNSITVCNGQNTSQCKLETEFDWQDAPHTLVVEKMGYFNPTGSFSEVVLPESQYERRLSSVMPRGDIDGNGVRDWPSFSVTPERQGIEQNSEISTCYYNEQYRNNSCIEADFNKDGVTDGWRVSTNNTLELLITDSNLLGTNSNQTIDTFIPVAEKFTNPEQDHLKFVGDYNRDGWPDLLVYVAYGSNGQNPELRYYPHSGDETTPYHLSNFDTIYTYKIETSPQSFRVVTTSIAPMSDIDGNGLPDFVVSKIYDGRLRAGLTKPVAESFIFTRYTNSNISFDNEEFYLANRIANENKERFFSFWLDVNSDGFDDWLTWQKNDSNLETLEPLYLHLNLGDGSFAQPVSLGEQTKLKQRAYVYANDNSDAVYIVPRFMDSFKIHDVNGDGKNELMLISMEPTRIVVEGCSVVQSATGNETKCGDALYDAYRHSESQYNNSALIDTAEKDDGVYYYDAIYFDEDVNGNISGRREETEYLGSPTQSTFVDAFGKGISDFVFIYGERYPDNSTTIVDLTTNITDEGVYIVRNRGSVVGGELYAATDMLKSVDNGDGTFANWVYRPLSSQDENYRINSEPFYEADYDYTVDANNPGDHLHFTSSMYVVAEMNKSNGAGSSNKTKYQYRGAVFDTQGRGFQGFREIKVQDIENKTISNTVFEQKWPLVGKQREHRLMAQNSFGNYSTVSRTVYDWQDDPINHSIPKVEYVYANQVTKYQYDLNSEGFLLSTSIKSISDSDVDEFGNVRKVVETMSDDFSTSEIETVSMYEANENTWFTNKLDSKIITSHVIQRLPSHPLYGASFDDGPTALERTKIVTTTYQNYSEFRQPKTVIISGNDADQITTTTSYNEFGLPSSISTSTLVNGSTQTRTKSYSYTNNGTTAAADGYFPHTEAQHGLEFRTTYDVALGVPLQSRDIANGVVLETSEVDWLGRKKSISKLGSAVQSIGYYTVAGDNASPSYATYKIVSKQRGMPETIQYLDAFDRLLRTKQQNFDGNGAVYTDTRYNTRGLVTFESQPYQSTGSAYGVSYNNHDSLGRVKSKTVNQVASSLFVSYQYSGYETVISAGNLPDMSRTYNAKQQLIETVDSIGGKTSYAYDSGGNPIVIGDANGNYILASYDALGNKQWVKDPNMGVSEFNINGFGEVEVENDSNGDLITFAYDSLGRVTRKQLIHADPTVPNSTFDFYWDTASGNSGCAIGFICRESNGDLVRNFEYDNNLRPTRDTRVVDGTSYSAEYYFDDLTGLPTGMKYPNELTLDYDYNYHGYLTTIKNAESGYVYKHITSQDSFGNTTGSKIGNDVMTHSASYSSETGQMTSVMVTTAGNNAIQGWEYTNFDIYGNVKRQENIVGDYSETFTYDDLHRLTKNSYGGSVAGISDIEYAYDAIGNLKYKSDYSVIDDNAYQYSTNGVMPNAVSSVIKNNETVSFSYDNKGNMTSGDGLLSAKYFANLKPYEIKKNGTRTFSYGADGRRYKQVYGDRTTYYLGKNYEVEGDVQRAYVADIAVITFSDTSGDKIRFTLKDRLGSATTLADEQGIIRELRVFDPFGKLKGENGQELSSPLLASLGTDVNITRRGFTDHEHLDEAELIHMNGRVYDYNLGRFMSVDPLIHEGSQGLNPYSYIMNNPLAGTDPTGYEPEKETVEVSKDSQVYKDADGNNYVSAGDGSDDYIKIDSVSGNSGGTQITQSFGDNGQVSSFSATNSAGTLSVSDIGSQQQVATFTSDPSNSGGVAKIPEGDETRISDNEVENNAGQNERDFWDNPGRHLPSAPQGLVDFVAGFGDSLSFNLTKHIRGLADIDGVDTNSDEYGYGNTTGTVVGLANAGRAGLQVYKGVNKAKQWRANSRTSRRTRARKIAAAGSYRPSASDAALTLIGGSGVDSYVSLMADED